MRWRAGPILLGALAALAGSCIEEEPEVDLGGGESEVGADTLEIKGGKPRDDHPEIALLWMKFDGKWLYCTATLVDRKIAITAGHCVKYRNQDRPGNYGLLEVRTPTRSGIQTHRYTVNGYHNFDGFPHTPGFDPDDIGLVRLSAAVPCSVARPAHLRRDSPPTGTVVSRWGYGVCDDEPLRKRVKHFRRGRPTFFLCPGDSGGPTLDTHGAVYQVNSGHYRIPAIGKDTVARVEKEWNGITRVMDGWGRAGRCP
jgi:hypothetical protein